MIINTLKSMLGLGQPSPEKLVQHLEQGECPCAKCGSLLSLDSLKPLKLINCPACQDLFLVPTKRNDWWLTRPLGAGGMGAVYDAIYSLNPGISGAVKVLQNNTEVPETFRQLLLLEGKIAKNFLKHPNLAGVYAYGFTEEDSYVIFEKVSGDRLDNFMKSCENEKIPEELVLYIALDILNALEFIYEQGFLYRDLKPENILFNEFGKAVVIDYGLCLSIDNAWNNKSDDIMGSPLYMPPERIRGEGEDYRADLYSLGMVLYHCLVGQPYFNETELMKIVQRQWSSVRLTTEFKMKTVDPEVAQFVDGLIRFDREERYGDYAMIREDILNLINKFNTKKTKNEYILHRRQH